MTAAEMKLAINGGEMAAPNLPQRHHFGAEERAAALRIIDDAIAKGDAPAYGGPEEEAFGKEFAEALRTSVTEEIDNL